MKLDMLDTIQARFIERCRADVQKLSELRGSSVNLADGAVDATVVRIVHGLAGAGGTFGFPDISQQAGDLETLLIDSESAEAEHASVL